MAPNGPKVRIEGGPPGERWAFRLDLWPSFHHDTGRWVRLARRLDRREDWYHEMVWDPITGQVFRNFAEPLSRHQGRGAAGPQR
jgi:hypothetical protein